MNPQLQDLRDIHLPPPTSVWPLAPGWWVLAAVIVVLGVAGFLFYRHRRHVRQQYAWRREALVVVGELRKQLTTLSTQQVLTQLSILIRRVAITQLPRGDVAALQGERWLAFLDLSLGEGFLAAGGAQLITAPYLPHSNTSILSAESLEELLVLVERWISRLENQSTQNSLSNDLQRQAS